MRYTVEQFPKNKDIDPAKLSVDQVRVRRGARTYTYGKKIRCKKCGKEHSVVEYWLKDKKTGRRDSTCRDCRMKLAGVIEIGKSRFAMKLFGKGFRRCTACKTILPLTDFSRLRGAFGGINNTCKSCSFRLHKEFQDRQHAAISDWYVRNRAIERGITDPSAAQLEEIRLEVIEERAPKYFIDGKEFVSQAAFARYIHEQYGIEVSTTEKRLSQGKTLEECKISEREMRSAAHTRGAIKVIDTINGKVFLFKNTNDPRLLKMFGTSTINGCIKSGKPTRITYLSKYKNPCTIDRVSDQKGAEGGPVIGTEAKRTPDERGPNEERETPNPTR